MSLYSRLYDFVVCVMYEVSECARPFSLELSGNIPEITACHDHLVLLDLSYNGLGGTNLAVTEPDGLLLHASRQLVVFSRSRWIAF